VFVLISGRNLSAVGEQKWIERLHYPTYVSHLLDATTSQKKTPAAGPSTFRVYALSRAGISNKKLLIVRE